MTEHANRKSADFAAVTHTVTLLEGDPACLAAAVAEAGPTAFHVSIHAPDVAARNAATTALRERGFRGAVDAIVQPAGSDRCAAILWTVDGDCHVHHPRPGVSTLEYRGGTLARIGHSQHLADGFSAAFDELYRQLSEGGFGPSELWKTWSYLPTNPDGTGSADGFVDFNLRRTEVFGDTVFPITAHETVGRAYPANTGVAEVGGRPSLTAIAGRCAGDVHVVGIENRRQRPACNYGPGTGRPRPAQFSRAVMLAEHSKGLVFMAGTASVVDSHTVGVSVDEQLETTLDITDQLLSSGALAGDGFTLTGGIASLLHLVVYVARPADLDRVRKLAAARVPVPLTCVVAPLTRDDLLVEVDGFGVFDIHPAAQHEETR